MMHDCLPKINELDDEWSTTGDHEVLKLDVTMCNPSAVAMHDGHCHLCQRLSSIPLRERLPTTTQHFRKKISTFKQLHSEVNSQRLLRYGSNPQLDDIRMTAETTQNFSFLQHTP
mmetsp:Transcript_35500/g.82878  ORF Transcript_35500/g.82878 Transcript_35500/m.82878 type:complete len:115 (-) Transcript_35500:397-741(-)